MVIGILPKIHKELRLNPSMGVIKVFVWYFKGDTGTRSPLIDMIRSTITITTGRHDHDLEYDHHSLVDMIQNTITTGRHGWSRTRSPMVDMIWNLVTNGRHNPEPLRHDPKPGHWSPLVGMIHNWSLLVDTTRNHWSTWSGTPLTWSETWYHCSTRSGC